MTGTIVVGADARSVQGGALAAGYDPNAPARIEAIAGHWELTTSEQRPLSIDIAANGTVTGISGACRLDETNPPKSRVIPSESRRNVFTATLVFSECDKPWAGGDAVHGFAVAYPLRDGMTQLVIGAESRFDPIHLAAAGRR
jgi:hypothetical protein